MENISCTRRIQFCAGHRVMGHENKCAHIHGHNYVAFITAQSRFGDLDGIGRVVDFSVLKYKIGGWIESLWDHGMILNKNDTELAEMMTNYCPSGTILVPQKLFLMDNNPTAENMAEFLLRTVCPVELPKDIVATRVVLYETENCFATAEL